MLQNALFGMLTTRIPRHAPRVDPTRITIDTASLLDAMLDLERLAEWPTHFVTRQASSFSRWAAQPGSEPLNQEWAWFERSEGEEHVMLDVDGPGALVRVWSADPCNAGSLRIYLDGAATPAIDIPFTDFFNGSVYPFQEPIAGVRAQGHNNYMPIVFRSHCRAVLTTHPSDLPGTPPDVCYQINYRQYDPRKVSVRSFTWDQLVENRFRINMLKRVMATEPEAQIRPLADPSFATQTTPVELTLTGNHAATIRLPAGFAQAIYRIRLQPRAAAMAEALRGTLLEITFDGIRRVQVPLGDFFGTAAGLNPFRSLPLAVMPDNTLVCNWVMPYLSTASLRLMNYSGSPLRLSGEIIVGPYAWGDNTMYFNAGWQRETGVLTTHPEDPSKSIWNYIHLAGGQGQYVGNMIHVINPVPDWWGEGNEQITFDQGDPSAYRGAGTEGYYGYAWADTTRFTHAYHNQSRADSHNCKQGHIVNSRFHIMDCLPFSDDLKFDMEIRHWASPSTRVTYAVTNWWYARPEVIDNLPVPAPDNMKVGSY